MTHRKAPALTAIASSLGALTLALGASVSPALAATGAATRCDQSVESPALPEATAESLSFEVVEHTVTGPDVPGRVSVDGSAEDGGSGFEPDPGAPRIENLLRRIFDDTRLMAPGEPESNQPEPRNAPLAIDKSEPADPAEPARVDADDDATGPELRGISRDDLVRFKRQMYRTDI